MTRLRQLVVAVAVMVVAAGCTTWGQSRFDATQAGFNPQSDITPANVGNLRPEFRAPDGKGTPLVAEGKVFVPGANHVNVYNADGSNCSGTTCPPLWQTDATPNDLAIAGSTLIVQTGLELRAYDVDGATNCGGTPKTCAPLWRGESDRDGEFISWRNITTTNRFVYVHVQNCGTSGCAHGIPPAGGVFAFDARGATNCTGTPRVCHPVWYGSTGHIDFSGAAAPTVANGKLYVNMSGPPSDEIAIFDANGTTNCSGSPRTCTPIGAIDQPFAGADETPVSNGSLYSIAIVGDDEHGPFLLRSYDASSGSLQWSSNAAVFRSAPAVAHGLVYVVRDDGDILRLEAYDAAGVRGCSGTPKVCTPSFSGEVASAVAGDVHVDVVVAGDVVFVSSPTRLTALDARGQTGCTGAPPRCQRLYDIAVPSTLPILGHPVIVGSRVYSVVNSGLSVLALPG